MIRTLVKLVVVALVLFATYHLGNAYWDNYQFEDSVQQAVQFSEHATAADITDKVMELAGAQDIPLEKDQLSVTRGNHRIEVNAVYFRDVELLPRHTRHWEFTIHVLVMTLS
jgi:hypothetical protein